MKEVILLRNSTRRAITGAILVAIAIVTISAYDALPYRIVIALGLIIAASELIVAANPPLIQLPNAVPEICILLIAATFYLFGRPNASAIIFLLLVTYSYDGVAYFIGQNLGKKFIKATPFPLISPKKSWEGTIAGVILSILVGSTFLLVMALRNVPIPPAYYFMTLFGGAIACAGDLSASATKRSLSLKDSDEILKNLHPALRQIEKVMIGMGGYLDRLDSLALTSCMFFLLSLFS